MALLPTLVLDLATFAASVEAVADTGLIVIDGDGRVASWNKGAALLTGLSSADTVGQPWSRVTPAAEPPLPAPVVIASAGAAGIETHIRRVFDDGARVTAGSRVRATASDLGGGWLLTFRQVDSPARPSGMPPRETLLLPALRELVMVADLDGIVTYWNAAATEVLGFTAEERVGTPMFAFVPEERRQAMGAMLEALKAGLDWEGEYPAVHKDGSTVWVEARAGTLRDDQGQPNGFVVVAHDIRARKQAEEALAQREADYRAAIETTGDGYWIVDAEGRILEVNDVYARLSGYTREELLQMRIPDLEGVETPEDVKARTELILRTGRDRFETFHRRKDGSRWPVEVTVAMPARTGRFYVFFRDLAERRLAEEALRTSEARLLNAQQAASLGSWEWDPATGEVWWSDAIRSMFGFGPDETPSLDAFLRVLHPHDRGRAQARVEHILQGGDDFADDLRIVTGDGSIRWIDSRGRAIRDESGRLVRVEGTDHDITDRRRAQEERDRLWNHSPDPMCVFDLEGNFTQVNPAWTERLGWTKAELLARPGRDLMHADDVPQAFETLARLGAGEKIRNFETRLRTRDGQWLWFSWNAQPMPDGQVHAFVRDITEEKRLDEQMRQSQKIEAIGRLAGGVAHDFNNLLTVINGYTALLLQDGAVRPTQREPLSAIRDAGERAAALTAQLLAFGRKAMVEPKVLDVNEITTASTRMLGRLIGEDVRMVTDLAPGLPCVRVDPSQLDQVLVNLVVNARDAMPRGGLLRIATSLAHVEPPVSLAPADLAPGTYVRLTVSDTGAGIAEDVRAHIFEPFYTTKDVGQGTGLGLAMVYGIVRQAGGTVTVESEPGHGSAFHVLLPAVSAQDVAGDAAPLPLPAGGRETVLVVEDEPGVRQLARILLEAQGYTVHTAPSAREALDVVAAAETGDVDLLITDVVMPGMSGRQLVQALRERHPALRVMFMSGYTDDAVLRHGVESSRDAFLQKPFTPIVLARRVREVLDATP